MRIGQRSARRSRLDMSTRLPLAFAASCALILASASSATADATVVELGAAEDFSVLGGSTVTNTGPTTMDGSVGVSPGTEIVQGGMVVGGTVHEDDAVARQAQSDLITAYNDAAGQGPTTTAPLLGGRTLVGGVYTAAEGDGSHWRSHAGRPG